MTGGLDNDVDIANMALGHLGKPAIVSMTQAGTEATTASRFLPAAKTIAARKSDWTFLREQAALTLRTNDREDWWTYRYDYPSRALFFRGIIDPVRPEMLHRRYELSSGSIYADVPDARGAYTTLQGTNRAAWSVEFNMAIAAKLAELMAPMLTRRRGDVETMRILFESEVNTAIQHDAAQEHTTYVMDESYITGRQNDFGGRQDPPRQPDGSSIWD